MTYLFTKEGCGKCDWVKTNVDLESMKDVTVMSLNRDDPEALALLAYYECVTLSEKKLPILVSDSERGNYRRRKHQKFSEGTLRLSCRIVRI